MRLVANIVWAARYNTMDAAHPVTVAMQRMGSRGKILWEKEHESTTELHFFAAQHP
jgi:hypothetical protein